MPTARSESETYLGSPALALGLFCVAIAFSGCATSSPKREPANLYPHKLEIRAYVDRGDYQKEIDAVAAQARVWVEQRAARGGGRLTVVFDLDETLLSNWPYLSRMDFGYVGPEWNRWVDEACAPAIESVREVYRTARRLGVAVVFITGRPESARASTERNLRFIDCADHVALICKPAEHRGTSVAFKTAAREKLTRDGHVIIANIGDQQSDLAGGFAERTFKLPNPFYLTE